MTIDDTAEEEKDDDDDDDTIDDCFFLNITIKLYTRSYPDKDKYTLLAFVFIDCLIRHVVKT